MPRNSAVESAHVLVAVSDSVEAETISTQLEAVSNFRVTAVSPVNDAMKTLVTRGADCIVSDHALPDVDGISFLEAVRAQHPDLPFILFTSEGNEMVASRAIHARVTDYLVKDRYREQWERLATLVDRAIQYYRAMPRTTDRQNRVRSLFEAMPDMVAVLKDGQFVYVNRNGVSLVGADDASELVGTSLFDVLVGENELTAAKLDAIQSEELYVGAVEEQLVSATGTTVPVDLTASYIEWEGDPAILVVVKDRSERRSLERRVQELARVHAIIREVNHVVISSRSREELEAGVCEQFVESPRYRFAWIGEYDAESGAVTPRAYAGYEAGYLDELDINVDDETGAGPTGQAIRTRTVQTVQEVAEDLRYERWRGEALERGYRSSIAVPLVSDGTIYGILNLYAERSEAFDQSELDLLEILGGDIAFALHALTDRVELERSEERLSLALDAANAGVWDWLVDEERVLWDEHVERLFGLDPGTFEGTYEGFRKRIHPDDRTEVEAAIQRALTRTGRFELEFRIVRDDGSERWILAEGKVLRDDAGTPVRVIGVDVDVTERKEREQHMRVIDRVLRHNLRNDLNVIQGNAELVRDETTGTVADLAERIVAKGDDLLRTADKERQIVEILTEQPVYDEVDVTDAVRRIVERFRSEYPATEFDCDLPEEATATVTSRFHLALAELVSNALRHSGGEAPAVSVAVERVDDRIQIRIADTNPPVPEMDVQVLTSAYEEPLYHGTGLGLWLVHWLVRRSNGTLSFRENDPRGNVVTITLEMADED